MVGGRVVQLCVVLMVAGCAAARSAPTGSASTVEQPMVARAGAALGSLTAADLVTIGRSAGMLSTRRGAHVQAFKAPGRVVWARFNPDVHDIDTDEYLAHDLIVVRSTDHVPDSFGRSGGVPGPSPASTPVAVTVAVSLILDASTGRVVEVSGEGADGLGRQDPAVLGTPSEVTLP